LPSPPSTDPSVRDYRTRLLPWVVTQLRIQSSACYRSNWPCVQNLVCSPGFPLTKPLPSGHSARRGCPPPLFASFAGTMGLSDFPPPFITDVLLSDSPCAPCLRGAANGGTSRVPRKVFRCVHGVCDHAGSGRASRWRRARCCLPYWGTPSAPRINNFRGSIPSPHLPLSTLALRPRGRPAMTQGQCGSLYLRCTRLSLATPCRLIPAHLPKIPQNSNPSPSSRFSPYSRSASRVIASEAKQSLTVQGLGLFVIAASLEGSLLAMTRRGKVRGYVIAQPRPNKFERAVASARPASRGRLGQETPFLSRSFR